MSSTNSRSMIFSTIYLQFQRYFAEIPIFWLYFPIFHRYFGLILMALKIFEIFCIRVSNPAQNMDLEALLPQAMTITINYKCNLLLYSLLLFMNIFNK